LQGFQITRTWPDTTVALFISEDGNGKMGACLIYKCVGSVLKRANNRIISMCLGLSECLDTQNLGQIIADLQAISFEGLYPTGSYYTNTDGKRIFNLPFVANISAGIKYFGAGLILSRYRVLTSQIGFRVLNRTSRSFFFEIQTANNSRLAEAKVFNFVSSYGKISLSFMTLQISFKSTLSISLSFRSFSQLLEHMLESIELFNAGSLIMLIQTSLDS
jgi:hypothetical protein